MCVCVWGGGGGGGGGELLARVVDGGRVVKLKSSSGERK